MSLEVISFSDGKHEVTKAANVLLKKHYLNGNTEKPNLTEADALGEMWHGGAEPDLMLIYGPARCHPGFPAWRIHYTEMVHMEPLKSMKFGALMKAIHRYTMVHQNYGTYIYFNYKLSLSESQSPTVRGIKEREPLVSYKPLKRAKQINGAYLQREKAIGTILLCHQILRMNFLRSK